MPLKKDILQLTGIFVIQIIFLIFGVYFLFQGGFIPGAVLIGSVGVLSILMVVKGKRMKEEYPEEYE